MFAASTFVLLAIYFQSVCGGGDGVVGAGSKYYEDWSRGTKQTTCSDENLNLECRVAKNGKKHIAVVMFQSGNYCMRVKSCESSDLNHITYCKAGAFQLKIDYGTTDGQRKKVIFTLGTGFKEEKDSGRKGQSKKSTQGKAVEPTQYPDGCDNGKNFQTFKDCEFFISTVPAYNNQFVVPRGRKPPS